MTVQTSAGRQVITTHARMRMMARRISETALSAVMEYGRVVYVRGAKIYVVGRKEVAAFLRKGIELADFEGIHVVCSSEGDVLTTYRESRLSRAAPARSPVQPRQMS